MTTYTITDDNQIEIDFHGVKPSADIRNKMKAVKIWWDPNRMIWHGLNNNETLAVAKEICGDGPVSPVVSTSVPTPAVERARNYVKKAPSADYALKVKIKDIIKADKAQFEAWERLLKDYVNAVMSEDNTVHSGNSVSKSQKSVWMNCFNFIAKNLSGLSPNDQEYELIFADK
jgi:hypothetical protein